MEKRIQMIDITLDELVAVLRKELLGVQQDSVMSRKEAAEYMDVTEQTLWNWSNSGVLKVHKIGGKLYYRKSELDSLFDE